MAATTHKTEISANPYDLLCGKREATIGDLFAWENAASSIQATEAACS